MRLAVQSGVYNIAPGFSALSDRRSIAQERNARSAQEGLVNRNLELLWHQIISKR